MENKIIERIEASGIVAVIRAENTSQAIKIAKSCLEGGISIIEITFTVPEAHDVIRKLVAEYANSDMLIGAGTVLDAETARIAIESGAEFIVSPGFDADTAKVCPQFNVPYFPGCLTLTEMLMATRYGAGIIKLFPGSAFGPDYVKAIKGPLPDIKIMPTGGVSLANVKDWFKAGVVAVGVGSDLTNPAKNGDYDLIVRRAKEYVQAIEEFRKTNKRR